MAKLTTMTLVIIAVLCTNCRSAKIQSDNDKSTTAGQSREMSSTVKYQDDMPDMVAVTTQCNDTFRTDVSYLIALNETGNFIDETDKTSKCFIRCLLEKTGVLSSVEGSFDPARAAVVFAGSRGGQPMNDLEEMATSCAAERVEECKCERAYGFMKCLMQMEIEKYEMNEKS